MLRSALPDDDLLPAPVDEEFGSRSVPGIAGLLLGTVTPRPYPINIYNLDDQSHSGIAGTLYPDGRYVPLPATGVGVSLSRTGQLPTTRYWEDFRQTFVEGTIVWDSTVVDSIDHNRGPNLSHLRVWDGTLMGEWPDNPPRAERVVNPEKAREAAAEAEREKQWT